MERRDIRFPGEREKALKELNSGEFVVASIQKRRVVLKRSGPNSVIIIPIMARADLLKRDIKARAENLAEVFWGTRGMTVKVEDFGQGSLVLARDS